MSEDYRKVLKDAVSDVSTFVRLTSKGALKGQEVPYRRVVVRPVLIKGERHLQFSYFTEKQDITKNYKTSEAEEKLDELLAMPFSLFQLESTTENLQVQITKGGKTIVHRSKPAQEGKQPDLGHDRAKELPLPPGKPDPFLQAVGIMNKQGGVIPSMQAKFTQVNEFLKLLEHTGELRNLKPPVNILDCGAGSSYLSFAAYHYINDVLGIPANLVGVEVNPTLVEKSTAFGQQLGLTQVCFKPSAIIDYQPEVPPDVVLALHACDTATDEALAQGVMHGARLILAVPCCHHELHEQVQPRAPFEPVTQHGILRQRMVDILTDAFRAQILRIMGYKTDVVEFVSTEHTDRNLMIRAVKRGARQDGRLLEEYNALKSFWGVTPYLERLLVERGWRVGEVGNGKREA